MASVEEWKLPTNDRASRLQPSISTNISTFSGNEIIARGTNAAIPEPHTYALLVAGLAMLRLFGSRPRVAR